MSNYNFTPTLNGLNNIDADEINTNTITSSTANIANLVVPIINGDSLKNCVLTNCTVAADPIDYYDIVPKGYMFASILEIENILLGVAAWKTADNIFTYQNTFTNYCPIATVAPTISTHLVNKDYVDNASHTLAGYAKLSDNQIFTGTNTFNSYCPISTVAPTILTHLTNKNYIDNNSHSIAGYAKLSDNQIFTGTNQFTKGITIGSSGGMTQSIQSTLITGQTDLLTNSTAAVVFGNALNSCIWRWNGFLEIFNTKNITSNYTITFPLQESYIIRTTTTDLTINIPIIDVYKIGLRINIIKTSNTTNTVTLVPSSGNYILPANQNTIKTTDSTILDCNRTNCILISSIMPTGAYGWVQLGVNVERQVGVYLVNTNGAGYPVYIPLIYTCTDLGNYTNQPITSGVLTTSQSGTVAGSYITFAITSCDNFFLVNPNYGIIGYQNTGFTGSIYLNYKNLTHNVVMVRASTIDATRSVRIFYNDLEQFVY